jgi:hypothetical protein
MLDHVNERPVSWNTTILRSAIISLNSAMQNILGLEVDSEVSLMMLKSPNSSHGRSWRQATVRNSMMSSCFRAFEVGP